MQYFQILFISKDKSFVNTPVTFGNIGNYVTKTYGIDITCRGCVRVPSFRFSKYHTIVNFKDYVLLK